MDQLINIWQCLHSDHDAMDKKYKPEDLIPQVIRLEKNQKKVLLFKTYGSVSLLIMLLLIFFTQFTLAFNSLLGIGIITTSILSGVIALNRLRFRISDKERSLSTRSLVEAVEAKIKIERKLFRVYLPLLLLCVIMGINLMYLEFLGDLDTPTRVLYHLVLSAGMVVAFLLGLSVRIKRYRKRFLPLLDRIQKLKGVLNSQPT